MGGLSSRLEDGSHAVSGGEPGAPPSSAPSGSCRHMEDIVLRAAMDAMRLALVTLSWKLMSADMVQDDMRLPFATLSCT